MGGEGGEEEEMKGGGGNIAGGVQASQCVGQGVEIFKGCERGVNEGKE